jgi:hypothetical protein
MSVEERLRADAERLAQEAAGLDHDALFTQIAATLGSGSHDEVGEPPAAAGPDAAHGSGPCVEPGNDDMLSLNEIRYHMGHALRSASCARRAAELFELLGNEGMATICWQYAAASGDRDAQDYVSEFIAPVFPARSANESRERFADLARSYQ